MMLTNTGGLAGTGVRPLQGQEVGSGRQLKARYRKSCRMPPKSTLGRMFIFPYSYNLMTEIFM